MMKRFTNQALIKALVPALSLAIAGGCSSGSDQRANEPSPSETSGAVAAKAPTAGETEYTALAADAAAVEAGKKLFSTCAVCHAVDPGVPSPAGPHLGGVVGRPIASAAGFPYSQPLKSVGGNWTPEKLDNFLKDPQAAYPGNAMAYAGIAKDGDRKAIIAYLASHLAN